MTDGPRGSDAWITDPQTYLDRRAATRTVPSAPVSHYLAMRDGVRLAVDIHLPDGERPTQGFPAVLIFTPYYRRFRLAGDAPAGIDPSPNSAAYREMFVPRGYALVVVDVRGTGASFGCRDSFRSPAERQDYAEVIEWVAAQGWCDGRLGATGISYLGAACDFAAASGHPALKAIAPISAVWDTYSDHFYPGGILLTDLATGYGRVMEALDQDRREDLRKYYYFAESCFEGPAPVDDDPEGVLLAEAIAADDEVALRLGVRRGTRVFHTRIVHRENGVPIQLEDRFVNPRWVPDYLETDFHRHTPNEVLVAACPITDVEHVVEAVRVDATTAERLEMDATQPCLSMIRRTWSGEHLISYARLIHPGDRYKLRSALSRRAS